MPSYAGVFLLNQTHQPALLSSVAISDVRNSQIDLYLFANLILVKALFYSSPIVSIVFLHCEVSDGECTRMRLGLPSISLASSNLFSAMDVKKAIAGRKSLYIQFVIDISFFFTDFCSIVYIFLNKRE